MKTKQHHLRASKLIIICFLILNQFINFGLISSATLMDQDKHLGLNTSISGDTGEFWLVDNYILMYGAYPSFYIIDISNPEEPTSIKENVPVTYEELVFAHYDKTLLFSLGGNTYYNNASLRMYELNKGFTNYTIIQSWENFRPWHIMLTNNTLYCIGTNYNFSAPNFFIYDFSDPTNLTIQGEYYFSRGGSEYYIKGNYIFSFHKSLKRLFIDKIENSTYISEIADITNFIFDSIIFQDDIFYICSFGSVQMYDHTDPENLSLIEQYTFSDLKSFDCQGTYGCMVSNKSFYTLDITNLSNFKILGQYKLGKLEEQLTLKDVILNDGIAFVLTEELSLNDNDGRFGGPMYVFDVTAPFNIDRLYPNRLWHLGYTGVIMLLFLGPASIIVIIVIILAIVGYINNKNKKASYKNLPVKQD